jgi:CheY-like chemotaxis protein
MESDELATLRVLVADDEPKLRALVATAVRGLGCQTLEAKDGDEAWLLAQAEHLDVIVLDVMMPGMSGWDVCRRVKSSARTVRGAPPKVLMLTGIGEHLNEMTSPLFAADAWIDKPFQLETLRSKVAELGRLSLREGAAPLEEPAIPAPAPSGPSLKKARHVVEIEGRDDDQAAPASPKAKAPAQSKAKKRGKAAQAASRQPARKKARPKKGSPKQRAPKQRAAKKAPKKANKVARPAKKLGKRPQVAKTRAKKAIAKRAAAARGRSHKGAAPKKVGGKKTQGKKAGARRGRRGR